METIIPVIRFYDPKKPYGELSNFYIHKNNLVINGNKYSTVEHYFQSMKFQHVPEYEEAIRTIKTPNMAKILACQKKKTQYPWQRKLNEKIRVDITIRDDWDVVKDDVMYTGLMAKFSQDKHCKSVLFGTKTAKLIESSSKDAYWGEGKDGLGLNRLGNLLGIVRINIPLIYP